MQLKRLQLLGFKTFADKTDIEFGDGLTAVVGPNGCGKSNISDALLWVMGEQNPRLLRGAESRDVIFSGTDRRKKLGMAEVRLTVDNSDRSLPIGFSEVTVTRRIYRSGESQYLLNNSPCRLKDIVELFLDTGVGKGAYSFVSQSEIDAVLSARAEDRRELFEEAAGIKKYRVKKREAVRRLEAAEANLTRIRDITHELDEQRAPMELQAIQARRYLELSERLQHIEVDLLVGDVQQADYELYAERTGRLSDEESMAALDARLAEMEHQSAAIAATLSMADRELEAARLAQQAAVSLVERTESRLQLARERETSSERTAEGLDTELHELAERLAALTEQIDAMQRRVVRSDADEAENHAKLLEVRSKLRDVESEYATVVRQTEDHQGALRKIAEERAKRESDLATAHVRLAEMQARRDRAEQEHKATEAALLAAQNEVNAVRESRDLAQYELAALQHGRIELEERRKKGQHVLRDERQRLDSARHLFAERRSRLNTLTELQESGEGFYQGVRAVLSAVKQGHLLGAYAPVVDIVSVPEKLRVAIEVALGGSAQDIVCDSEREAKAAIEWLKSHRAGRATFLALPLLRPGPSLAAKSLAGISGLLGVAADLVASDSRFQPVLDLLLGRVVLAESMDAALDASRRLSGGWSRIVTLEGEVLTPGGALTGGSLGGRGAHLVGRKGEIDDLRSAMVELQAEVDRQQAHLEQARAAVDAAEVSLADVMHQLSSLQAKFAAAEQDLAGAERELKRLLAVKELSSAECDRIDKDIAALAPDVAALEHAVAAAKAEDTTADDAIAEVAGRARVLAEERDSIRAESIRLEVENGRAIEKRSASRREVRSAEEALQQVRRTHAAKLAQRELAGSQFADAHLLQRELEERLRESIEKREEADNEFLRWRELRRERYQANVELANVMKELARQRAAVQQSLHDSELKIARLEVRLAQTAQRLNEEYGITPEEALARPQVTDAPREIISEVARLRREVRQMGHVNTGAVEEFERLTERHDFLSEQSKDLEEARLSILAAITEIDESTRGTFLETFDAVSEEFSLLFARLFGGGTTRLVLTNPDDLLETGIEVIAQPPGKKPQHLSLLSGGERALTAVALLFSFLAVRPSPFVLLDEVDAPLDGANVEKFVNLLRDFTERTQFLIITHNPTTMEAAPHWYGVTMKEPGVSSILAYRVPQDSVESEPDSAVVLSRA